MALADPFLPVDISCKIDHFHEYDLNTEELFECREIFTLPSPTKSETKNTSAQATRVAKLRNVLSKVTRKKSFKSKSMQTSTSQSEIAASRHATFPRMKTEREIHVQDLHDEMFGIGAYAPPPSDEKYDDWEPEPWVSPYRFTAPATAKTKSCGDELEKSGTGPQADDLHRMPAKEKGPFWEEEFELPEPEISVPSQPQLTISGYIPLHISASYISKSKSGVKSLSKAPSQKRSGSDATPKPPQKMPIEASLRPSARLLTGQGIREALGDKIADDILTELTLRMGPPLSLPPREDQVDTKSPRPMAIREKSVVQTYALWASIFIFQKLIATIRLGLERFKPTHRGILGFEFEVRVNWMVLIFRTTKYLATSISRPSILSFVPWAIFSKGMLKYYRTRRQRIRHFGAQLLAPHFGRRDKRTS